MVPRMVRSLFYGMHVALALAFAAPGCTNRTLRTSSPAADTGCLPVGSEAPEIAGEDIDGVPFKLSDYRGQVVLLDFWGHW